MTLVVVNKREEGAALAAIDKARALVMATREQLASARTADDFATLAAQGHAISVLTATLKQAIDLQCDAGEIVVSARRGQALCEAAERATRAEGRPKNGNPQGNRLPAAQKTAESKRAPLAALSTSEQKAYFRACRDKGEPPSVKGASDLGRLPPESRKKAIATFGEVASVRRAISQAKPKSSKRPARSSVAIKSADAESGSDAGPRWDAESFEFDCIGVLRGWFEEYRARGCAVTGLLRALRASLEIEEKRGSQHVA